MGIKLELIIDTPPAEKSAQCMPLSVEDRVRDLMERIDSGMDSTVEWNMLRRIYRSLRGINNSRAKNLIKMMEPILHKNGYYDKV